jgi:DNA-binding MarR family transcriptional regulator
VSNSSLKVRIRAAKATELIPARAGAVKTPRGSEKIDTIFRQWRTERPDIDASPVHIYGLICELYLQSTAFINEILAPYDLYRGTFDALTALRRAGAPYSLTPKQLTKSLMLSAAGLTSRLDRLEAMKLIARLPEPSDRRTLRITLTSTGKALVDKLLPLMFEEQRRRLEPLGQRRQKRLAVELKVFADSLVQINGQDVVDDSVS